MPGVESNLDELDKRFQDALSSGKNARRRIHEEAGAAVQQLVRTEITGSGVNDSRGRVRGWQERYVGTKGGYAAVRPVKGGQRGKNPGAITNYLEHGHIKRGKRRSSKKIQKMMEKDDRAKGHYVQGYYFYKSAEGKAQIVALDAAERYADEIAEKLGD